mgnify:CR=1 FL=1
MLGLEPMLGRLQDAWPDEQRKTATMASGSAPPQACVPTATWKFPRSAQHGFRTYQKTMSNAALLENTLVSLPTGMGKTLIASVVMHNFLQWFPSGTVVFMAPTRPLVQQQIGACCRSVGLSPEDDALMLTGEDLPDTRAARAQLSPSAFSPARLPEGDRAHARACAVESATPYRKTA